MMKLINHFDVWADAYVLWLCIITGVIGTTIFIFNVGEEYGQQRQQREDRQERPCPEQQELRKQSPSEQSPSHRSPQKSDGARTFEMAQAPSARPRPTWLRPLAP